MVQFSIVMQVHDISSKPYVPPPIQANFLNTFLLPFQRIINAMAKQEMPAVQPRMSI